MIDVEAPAASHESFRQKQVHLVHFGPRIGYILNPSKKSHDGSPAIGQPHIVPVFGLKRARYSVFFFFAPPQNMATYHIYPIYVPVYCLLLVFSLYLVYTRYVIIFRAKRVSINNCYIPPPKIVRVCVCSTNVGFSGERIMYQIRMYHTL